MKNKLVVGSMVVMISLCFAFSAIAAGKATEAECIAKCEEAATLIQKQGLDAALKQLSDRNGPFVWKDTYVFTIDLNKKTVLAHPIKPALVGKNLIGIKDINGKMFFAEFINVAKQKGKGWVSYMWPKPGEKKPSPKKTYVLKVPGQEVAVAAGIYE